MDYATFLARVIKDGIEAAEKDYAGRPDKRKGAVEGFRACDGKRPPELAELLSSARNAAQEAFTHEAVNYWEIRCFEAEVEWVLNCISAATGQSDFPTITTARGLMKAASILRGDVLVGHN